MSGILFDLLFYFDLKSLNFLLATDIQYQGKINKKIKTDRDRKEVLVSGTLLSYIEDGKQLFLFNLFKSEVIQGTKI